MGALNREAAANRLAPPQVLVVSLADPLAQRVHTWLANAGIPVRVAASAEEATEILYSSTDRLVVVFDERAVALFNIAVPSRRLATTHTYILICDEHTSITPACERAWQHLALVVLHQPITADLLLRTVERLTSASPPSAARP